MIDKPTPTKAEALQVAADALQMADLCYLAKTLTELVSGTSTVSLWLVEGKTGEYSDRVEWLVAIYPNQEFADMHAALAKKEADRIYKEHRDREGNRTYPNGWEVHNKWDRDMVTDHNGVEYIAYSVEFLLRPEDYLRDQDQAVEV